MKTFYLLRLEDLRLVTKVNATNELEAENILLNKGYNVYECRITDDISEKHSFRNIYN